MPDESKLVLTTRPGQGDVGDVVLFDRTKGEALPLRFERPKGSNGQPLNMAFGALVVSKSGRWVASASLEGQEPLACVWRVEDGRLVGILSRTVLQRRLAEDEPPQELEP